MLLFTLLSCTSASHPTSWADCPDPTCRHETLHQAWQEENEVVLATLPSLDPIEQETLVQHLLGQYPQQQQTLCAALPPDSAGGQRCARVQARPHLTQGVRHEVEAFAPRAGGGPSRNILQQPKTAPTDWPVGTQKMLGNCSPTAACTREKAQEAAIAGNLETAGTLCRAAEPVQIEVYWECLFETAEVLAAAKRYPAWDQAARLCNGSEKFVHGCLHHTVALALPDIPGADDFTTEHIDAARSAEQTYIAAVGGAKIGEHYADRMWALWTWQAFLHAEATTGQLLPVLPDRAAPHIRVAAAYHMLQSHTDWSVSLDTLTGALSAALAVQAQPEAPSGKAHTPTLKKAAGFWPEDRRGEEGIPAIFCAGDSRRPTDSDPEIDTALAVLEAAGRLARRPPAEFFVRVVQDTDAPEVVRWTAARILTAQDPQAAAALTADALTPLIERRLKP